ncbi:MAG: molybdenum ABC transporter ATP-binding protein [Thermoanaerobaculia bacterium]
MIELDLSLPLAAFSLQVSAKVDSDAVAVLGPSGSGKTSLLESIAGLRAAHGRILLDGDRLLDSARGVRLPPERRRIGYVPQDACLFPHLDVRRNVRFGMRAGGREGIFDEAVAILEIEPLLARFPATLSGGERQRASLARAIATEPRLLLLDEPLAAVDVELRERILPYLLRVRETLRIPFLYVTHNTGEAAAVTSEAMLLRRGTLARQGPTAQVIREMMTTSADPDARFDNVVAGELEASQAGDDRLFLRAGEARLVVPAPPSGERGGRAVFAVAPEDILVSTRPPAHVSARNVFPGRVITQDVSNAGAWVRVAADGLEWTVRLTRAAAEDLGLEPGARAWLAIKTHAFRRLR